MIEPFADGDGGVLQKALIRNYTGNSANDREIDLGDDYQLVEIRCVSAKGWTDDHGVLAWALGDAFGAYIEESSVTQHSVNSAAAKTVFQGKMTGADVNKVKLGDNGALAYGFNVSGLTYRILAWKFSSVEV